MQEIYETPLCESAELASDALICDSLNTGNIADWEYGDNNFDC